MNEEQREQLEALFKETIYPALCEDFEFVTPAQAKDAVRMLIDKLSQVDINDIVPMDIEED